MSFWPCLRRSVALRLALRAFLLFSTGSLKFGLAISIITFVVTDLDFWPSRVEFDLDEIHEVWPGVLLGRQKREVARFVVNDSVILELMRHSPDAMM